LADLEITPKYRETVIKEIKAEDYSQGPIVDTLNSLGEMWEYKIKYPLKGEKQ
jgi:hypothetical protein